MRETSYWPRQKDPSDLGIIAFYLFIVIAFLGPLIVVLIGISQNEVKTYNSVLTVIEKCEKESNEMSLVFNPAAEMSQVQSNRKNNYIIVVDYANAEDGKAKINVDVNSYNKVNVGDTVSVKISESYSPETGEMLYYEISYVK